MASPPDFSQQDTEACDDSSSSDEDSFDINNDSMTNDTFQRGSQKLAQEKEVMIRPNRNIFESEKEGEDPETSDEDDTEDTFDIHRNTITDSVLERYEKRKGAVAPRERPVRPNAALASETTDTFEESDSFDVRDNAWTESFHDRVKNKMASEGPRPRPNRRRVPSVSTPAVNSENVSGSQDEEEMDSFNVRDNAWTESFQERVKNKMASEGPRPRPSRRKIPSVSTPADNPENVSGSQDEEEADSFNVRDNASTESVQPCVKNKVASEGPRPRPSSRKVPSVSTPTVNSENVSGRQYEEEQDAEDEHRSNINHRSVTESILKIVSVKGASATPTRPDRRASSTPTSNADTTVNGEDEISEDGDLEQTHSQHHHEGEISLEDGDRDIVGGLGVTHISASDSPGTGDEKELPIMSETPQPRTEQSLPETDVATKNSLNDGHKSKSPTPQPVLGPAVEDQVKDESNGDESEDEGESIFSEMESNMCLTTSTIPGEISADLSRPSSGVVQHNFVSDLRIRNTSRTKTSAKSKSGSDANSTSMPFANSAQKTPPEPDRMGTGNSSESDRMETGNGSESDQDQMETGNGNGSESEPEQTKSKSSLRVPSRLTGNSKGQSLNLLESEPQSAADPEAVEVSHSSCRNQHFGSVNREPFTSKKSVPQNEDENDASLNSESELSGELSHVDSESKSNIQLSSHPSKRLPADTLNQSSACATLSNLGQASFSSTEPPESFVVPLVPPSFSNSSTNTNSNIVQAEAGDDTFHFLHLLHQVVRLQREEVIPNEIEDVDSLLQDCPISDSGFKLKSANFLPAVYLKVSDKNKAEEFLLAKKKISEERLAKAKLHLTVSSESESEIEPEPRPLRFSRKPRSESNRPLKHPSEIYSQVMSYHHKTSSQTSSQQSLLSLLGSQSQSQKSLQNSSQPEQIVEEQNTSEGSDAAIIVPAPTSAVPSILTSPPPRPAFVPDKGENVDVALKNKERMAEQEDKIAESASAVSISIRNKAITPVQSSHSSSGSNQSSPPNIVTSHPNATVAHGQEVGASVIQHEISTKNRNRESTTSTTKLTIDSNKKESCSASQSNSSNLSEESAKDTDDGSSSDRRSPTRGSYSKKVKSLLSSSQRERSMTKSKVELSSTLSTTNKIRETLPAQEEEEDGAQKTRRSLLSMHKSKIQDISSSEKSIIGKGGRMSTTRSISNLESKSKHSESMSEKDKSDSEPESEVEIPEQEHVGQDNEYSLEIEEDAVSNRGEFEEEEPHESDLNNSNDDNNNDEGKTSEKEEGGNEATQQEGNSSRRENKTFPAAPSPNRNSQRSIRSSQPLELGGNSLSRSNNQNKDKSGSNSSPAKAKSGIRRSREPLSPASRTGTRSSPRLEQSTKYKSVRNRSSAEEETVHPPSPKRSKQSVIQPLRLSDTQPFQREGEHDPIKNQGSRSLPHQSVRLNSKSLSVPATATVNLTKSVKSVRGSQISTPPALALAEAEASLRSPVRRQRTTSHVEPEPPAETSGAASVNREKKKSAERERTNVERREPARAPPQKTLSVPKKRPAQKVKKDVNYYMRNDNMVSKEDVLQNLQEFNINISRRKVDELHEYLNKKLEKLLDELTANSGRPNGMFNYRHLEAVLKREGLVPPELGKNSLLLIFASTLIHSDYCKAKGVLIPKDGEQDTHEF